jgi:cell division protein FtsB
VGESVQRRPAGGVATRRHERPTGPVHRIRERMRSARESVRTRIVRAARGDRPMIVATVGAAVLAAVVLSGPAQSYLDARERVAALEAKSAGLDEANEQLERRVDDLNDPLNIELLAREQQGLVRPGEVAYSLVPPEVDRPRITAPRDAAASEPEAWYVRAWQAVAERFRD